MEKYTDKAVELIMQYGPKLLLAILTLIIGLWIIKGLTRNISRVMEKRNTDASLRPFLKSLINIGLKAMLIVSVMGMIGIEMTSFIAVLGAAGLAVGMALSGSLQNFAGGVMILVFKPFKVGDFVEAQGYTGTVKEIQIFVTLLLTPDNKTIILPNGPLSSSNLVNFSAQELRRIDFTFGIGYSDDIDKAKALLQKLVEEDNRILKDPAPFIAVSELADSSVNFVVRTWAKSSDYWNIFFDMQEKVKKTFDANSVSIPFPQTDVHLHKAN